MKYAHIDQHCVVVGIYFFDKPLPEIEFYIECDESVDTGFLYSYETGAFSAPEPLPLEPELNLTPIVIDSVTGVLTGFDDRDNEYTCRQNEAITLVGPLAVPDQFFRIPLVRTDTGREVPVVAKVENQIMTITAVFPTAGYWECNSELINRAFEQPLFSMETLNFTVI